MKVVYPVCCGVDVHKSFFIATIITTTSDIQPNYSRKRFSTFNNDIIRFADWLSQNNCNDVCMESTGKYWIPVFNILESQNINVIIAIARMILTAIYNMLSTGEVWNPCDLFKIDMPDDLKAKQEEKAVKQAVKFLEKRGYLVS